LQRVNAIRSGELGALELRGGPCTYDIRGVKYYVENGRVTCSGLPKGQCVDAGDGLHYWYHAHAGEQAKSGTTPVAQRVLREYQRDAPYHHGVVMEDGRVEPIRIGE
jgi:hypothetical protein